MNGAEQGLDLRCLPGAEKGESVDIHGGDGAAPKAKARNMRAFLWAALGKGCIRMRQDRAESEVIQETLFGFFYEKGGCVTAIGWKIW